jgi:peptidoglycan-associated lipoprotein
MIRYSRAALIVALLALTAAACRKQPVVEPAAPAPVPTSTPAPPPPPPPTTPPAATNTAERERALAETKANLLLPVYFAYDAADIGMDARANLDMKVQIMRANPGARIRIEGHCDSRGSTEYNIALGQRRAAAARQYLIDHGIPAARIETVSLGEERPALMGENEEAWAKNRRGEFLLIAGDITVPVGN